MALIEPWRRPAAARGWLILTDFVFTGSRRWRVGCLRGACLGFGRGRDGDRRGDGETAVAEAGCSRRHGGEGGVVYLGGPVAAEAGGCSTLATKQRERRALHRRAAPERFNHIQHVPHAVRRLRPPLGLSLGRNAAAAAHAHGPECQVQHWKEGGHDKLCKLLKKQAAPSSATQIKITPRL